LTLLALAGIGLRTPWSDATKRLLRTVDIMEDMRNQYRKRYAPNSRETIRRYTLHQLIEARVVDLNPDDPSRPTNSGYNKYSLSDAAIEVIRHYSMPRFEEALNGFKEQHGALTDLYRKTRKLLMVPVTLPGGRQVVLSAGEHNRLQKAIVEQFGARFARGAVVLYVGDTAKKHLVFERDMLARLSLRITEHDKLPDVVMYSEERHWLYLIEAVTSHGPMTPVRVRQLRTIVKGADVGLIYVTAFLNRDDFKRCVADIAWETEVWIADDPDHLIHFDGHRFLGPYQTNPSATQ